MLRGRTIDPALIESLRADGVVPLGLLVYADFPGDPARMWTGLGWLDYEGERWGGVGDLMSVSAFEETTDTGTTVVKVGLGGLEHIPGYSPAALGDYVGRAAKITLVIVDHDRPEVLAELVTLGGTMDEDETVEQPGEDGSIGVTTTVTIARRDRDHLLPRPMRMTHEDQRILRPGETGDPVDLFFEFVPALQKANFSPAIDVAI